MLHLIEFGAVISFGLFGILLARKNRLDFIGVFTVAFITAFAGGTLRDLFLDRHPLFWIANDHYAVTVFCLALGSILIPAREVPVERWLQLPDALGLGLFAIVGANHALEAGTSLFIASLMGVVTGTAGGAISDVICNEVPRLFKATPLYATCAFAGCWGCFAVQHAFGRGDIALLVGIVIVVVSRLAAIRWNVCLPEHRAES
ncbi:MAG: putative membrane protein YeiH [Limisphaerales bacterium]|jgi:uncharacterized membrane protein YeiH